jgi:hypothetical protein
LNCKKVFSLGQKKKLGAIFRDIEKVIGFIIHHLNTFWLISINSIFRPDCKNQTGFLENTFPGPFRLFPPISDSSLMRFVDDLSTNVRVQHEVKKSYLNGFKIQRNSS